MGYQGNNLITYLTLANTLFLAFLAWKQHKLNENKLRLDLYEKRFEIFKSVRELIITASTVGNVDINDIYKFNRGTTGYEFLLEDIKDYINSLKTKVLTLIINQKDLLDPKQNITNDKRSAMADENYNIKMWLEKQFDESTNKFKKYLEF